MAAVRPAAVGRPADDDLRAPMLANYVFSAMAGLTWYMQFFFYTMGETQMGQYKFSSWTLHMASIIIFSTLWGVALHEWRGSSKKTHALITAGIAVLILSTVIVGYGNKLAPRRIGSRGDRRTRAGVILRRDRPADGMPALGQNKDWKSQPDRIILIFTRIQAAPGEVCHAVGYAKVSKLRHDDCSRARARWRHCCCCHCFAARRDRGRRGASGRRAAALRKPDRIRWASICRIRD